MEIDQRDFLSKWYLSTDGYYFKYRPDRNDNNIIRADLYNLKTNDVVKNIRVSEGYGVPHKSHHQVINCFEVMVTHGFEEREIPDFELTIKKINRQ